MRLDKEQNRERIDPNVAMINIVFLLLMFFIIAGQIAAPIDTSITLPKTKDLALSAPQNALLIFEDGELSYQGNNITEEGYLTAIHKQANIDQEITLRIIPDRDFSAKKLIALQRRLLKHGNYKILIITEKSVAN